MRNAAWPSAEAVFEAINSGDLSMLEHYVTDDFVDHGSPFPIPAGPDGYRQILGFVTGVLRIRYELDDVVQTEDRIVLRATAHGVGVEALHGPGSAGLPYAMATIHVYRTEGERLAEHWGVRDEFGARIQLGTAAAPDLGSMELTPPR